MQHMQQDRINGYYVIRAKKTYTALMPDADDFDGDNWTLIKHRPVIAAVEFQKDSPLMTAVVYDPDNPVSSVGIMLTGGGTGIEEGENPVLDQDQFKLVLPIKFAPLTRLTSLPD